VKRFLVGFLTGAVFLPLAAIAVAWLGLVDVRADAAITPWFAAWLSSSVHRSVIRQAAAVNSQAPAAKAEIIAGGKLYVNDCAGCHGAGLKGGGIGPALYGIEHKLSNDAIAGFIRNPRAPMPNFGFTEAQISDIVAYLGSLDGGLGNTMPVVTFSPAAPVDQATISVTFPGTPPTNVRVLPVMHMGTSTHHTAQVQLQPSPTDPHTFTGRIEFSMGGPWTVQIEYDGHELDVPLSVGS